VSTLVMSSPFLSYKVPSVTSLPLKMEVIPKSVCPSGSAVMCGGDAESKCLVGKAIPAGLVVWPFGESPTTSEAATLSVKGQPWRLLAGAVVRCSKVAEILTHPGANETLCLLLAGWDGQRLPVAAVPLSSWASTTSQPLPMAAEVVVPRFEAPVDGFVESSRDMESATSPTSLHISAESGRLWAVFPEGHVQAWDLFGARRLGSWWPQWPLRGAAVCEAGGRLLLAGLDDEGPVFGTATLPPLRDAASSDSHGGATQDLDGGPPSNTELPLFAI